MEVMSYSGLLVTQTLSHQAGPGGQWGTEGTLPVSVGWDCSGTPGGQSETQLLPFSLPSVGHTVPEV